MIEIGYMACCDSCQHRNSEIEERQVANNGRNIIRTIIRCRHDAVCGDILKARAEIPHVYKGV